MIADFFEGSEGPGIFGSEFHPVGKGKGKANAAVGRVFFEDVIME